MQKYNKNIIWKFSKYSLVAFNFIASLSSIIGLLYTLFSDEINNSYTWIWVIGIIFFISMLIAAILLLRSEKYDSWKECSRYASGIHEILHCLRDMNKSIDDLQLRKTKMEKEDFLRMITSDCIDIMNKLSTILSDSIQCKVRTCIKLTDFVAEKETDLQKINLITQTSHIDFAYAP